MARAEPFVVQAKRREAGQCGGNKVCSIHALAHGRDALTGDHVSANWQRT